MRGMLVLGNTRRGRERREVGWVGVSRGVGGRVEELADGGALVVHAIHRCTRMRNEEYVGRRPLAE